MAWTRNLGQHLAGRVAFTLIEVLVVVAIIALLVSILVPSLARARWQAKLTACRANLHDLGTSLHLYAHDHDPYFPPPAYVGTTEWPTLALWQNHLQCDDNLFILWYRKYATSEHSFTCPATTYRVRTPAEVTKEPAVNGIKYVIKTRMPDGTLEERNDWAHFGQLDSDQFGTSYEYTVMLTLQWLDPANEPPDDAKPKVLVDWCYAEPPFYSWPGNILKTTRASRYMRPAFCILMYDADEPRDGNLDVNNYPNEWDNHGKDAMNILFADGHARMARRSELAPPGSHGGPLFKRQCYVD